MESWVVDLKYVACRPKKKDQRWASWMESWIKAKLVETSSVSENALPNIRKKSAPMVCEALGTKGAL